MDPETSDKFINKFVRLGYLGSGRTEVHVLINDHRSAIIRKINNVFLIEGVDVFSRALRQCRVDSFDKVVTAVRKFHDAPNVERSSTFTW